MGRGQEFPYCRHMFIGHFAVGLAAKPLAPQVPLPALLLAPQVADVLWPVLVGTGIERARLEPGHMDASPLVLESIPWSHSLLTLTAWALVCALGYFLWRRDLRGAAVIAALVLSHWVLDWVTHEPDMPLYPGGARFGLGLWNSLAATVLVELAMFALGVWLYARTTSPTGRWGHWGWVALVGFLLFAYVAALFSPAPTLMPPVLVSALLLIAVIVVWGWSIERQRVDVNGTLPKTTHA